jgi:hypothetical protein
MTKPTDDLEAVRAVAEALQGFDAKDQERIIRWAREKLGHAPSPAVQLPATREQAPPPPARDIPAPAAAPKLQNLRTFERPEARRPEVEPAVEQLEIEQFEVERPDPEQYETDQSEEEQPVEEPRGEPPAAVNIMMPPPEHKNRAPMVIGIILLTVAVIFLVVMIVSHGK